MLSVVVATWTQSDLLPRLVDSVKDLADEIVVVTDKSDATAKVGRLLGCKVYYCPRPGIVEIARNFSISKAKGDWILILDADEEVTPALAKDIKSAISKTTADYYRIPRKNIIFNKWIQSQHWWPDYSYRLFKKGSLSWQESIHSLPITQGPGSDFPINSESVILHHNYQTTSQFIDRLNRYTDFQSRELFAANVRFFWSDLITKPYQEFLSQYFSRRGYQDGLHGLALALLQAFSQLVVYLKLWQIADFPTEPVTPARVLAASRPLHREFWWWYTQSRIDTSSGPSRLWWRVRRQLHL